MRIVGVALVTALVVAAVVLGSPSRPDAVQDTGMHVFQDDISDVDLTAEVPVIVSGTILSRSELGLRDDPYLPSGWQTDPPKKRIVDRNPIRTKWRVSVLQQLKGQAPSNIWVTYGGSIHLSDIGPPGGSNYEPQVGDTVQLWLFPEAWFGQSHYVLVRAKKLDG